MVWLLGMAVGIAAFLCIYGVHVLNVTYTDWLVFLSGQQLDLSHWSDGPDVLAV